jgi:hypothetical protein
MTRNASDFIAGQVLAWPGVTRHPHRFGGIEFRCEGKEIGHLHGDRLLDIPFPKTVRDELVGSGRAEPHHRFPDSGWVSFWLKSGEDANKAVELLRLKYNLITKKGFPSEDGRDDPS